MSEPTQLTMEQLDELLTSAVKKALEPLTQVDRKAGILPTDADKDLEAMTPQERSLRFLKAVWAKDVQALAGLGAKALTEGTGSAGGYLVPEEFQSEVLRIAGNYGLARRLCRIAPMTRDKQNWPKAGSSGVTAYWVDEAGKITGSTPTFGQVPLDTKKCAGIAALSNELVADATVDVLGYLYEIFAEAIAKAEDTQWLTGTGSPITGILGSADVNVVTMGSGDTAFSKVHADDLLSLIDAVTAGSETGGAFFFHRNILTYLRKLKDSNGQYIWNAPAAAAPGTIWGYPYYLTEVMPSASDSGASTKFIAFGNPKYTLFGDRKQLAVAISQEATVGSDNLFEQDMQALRLIERVDIQLAIPEAYSVLRTAAS